MVNKIVAALLMSLVGLANQVEAKDRPNIVWIVSEDNGARWLGAYGNPAKPTPTLDKMAAEGFLFTNTYASVPVCAPQRSTWITGINAISMGTQGMRSGFNVPDNIKFYPEIFREIAYYTSKGNDAKSDYNLRSPRNPNDTWNDPKKIVWENLKKNQPFIHVFNTHATHESRSFGGFNPEKDKVAKAQNLASYHPDLPGMHFVYDKYNKCLQKLDGEVAGWLKELEENGLAENTIVIYSSDHGGVLPRSKRYLYNSGTHCPLIVRIPQKFKHLYPAKQPGMKVDELVSFTDFPKTWLSLGGASAEQLKQMQGRVFLGSQKEAEPEYIFTFRNRMDDRMDMVRSVRDHKHLYIRNYMPFVPNGQFLPYTYNMEATRAWKQYFLDGKASKIESRFFGKDRASDEFYLYNEDYDNVKNVASAHQAEIKKMRQALREWQLKIFDSGFLSEYDMTKELRQHELTAYEYVRKPDLYPLAEYIDMADKSLEYDPSNIPLFVKSLDDKYIGKRHWSILGLLNLSFAGKLQADSKALAALESFVNREGESVLQQAYASWVLIREGKKSAGLAKIREIGKDKKYTRTMVNMLDWIDFNDIKPVAIEYFIKGEMGGVDATRVLASVLIEDGSPELAELTKQSESLRHKIKAKEGRIKKLKAGKEKKYSPERVQTEIKKAQAELDQYESERNEVLDKMRAFISQV
ncbi:probable sulfatase atsG [Lentisphaera araneosa HTCC2155]|uniref:Probable sulfatase atsG n=1 Tax=Lentisphaera araneosa HTCC2155 TaxID=313628 RepID=A6DPE8_9BACT|nr:sulfatase [Lentisphaera araneosa]EDM26444.1 probable sulfatase atsG [Lentisphaera araneosa HTCC2155]